MRSASAGSRMCAPQDWNDAGEAYEPTNEAVVARVRAVAVLSRQALEELLLSVRDGRGDTDAEQLKARRRDRHKQSLVGRTTINEIAHARKDELIPWCIGEGELLRCTFKLT